MNRHSESLREGIVLLLTFFSILFLAIGCCDCFEPKEVGPEKALFLGRERFKVEAGVDESGEMQYTYLTVMRLRYEGHYFTYFGRNSSEGGWVHDPNCPTCGGKSTDSILSEYQILFGTP